MPRLRHSRVAGVTRTLEPANRPEPSLATSALFERLAPADRAAVRDALRPAEQAELDAAPELDRRRLTISYGLRDGTGSIAERTGLSAAVPPRDVHSMTRNDPRQLGGSLYYADLVVDWLSELAGGIAATDRLLDFSCSSGRLVRVLAALHPEVSWLGCDPNRGAVEWAAEQFPAVEFFVSPLEPPLPLADGELAAAFAISVWSHYSAAAALGWLGEMHRVLRPGGLLLLTAHGLNSCVYFQRMRDSVIEARIGRDWTRATADALGRSGHCFWDVFDAAGDHGVHSADWGLAFFTPEWLLEHVTPEWSVVKYRLGRAEGNQDVYLLRREGP